jgi:hypothetical protein
VGLHVVISEIFQNIGTRTRKEGRRITYAKKFINTIKAETVIKAQENDEDLTSRDSRQEYEFR